MKSDAIVGALKQAAVLDVDVDEALDQLTELVEVAHAKPVPQSKANIDVILSEVPLGFADKTCVVGWDTCGSCHLLISRCTCKAGPSEPQYVKFFRSGNPAAYETRPETASKAAPSQMPTAVTEVNPETPLSRSSGEDVPSGQDIIPTRICKDCGQDTMVTEGDENDDGTFTCFACQNPEEET